MLQTLPRQGWAKYDVKVPYDWERHEVPASVEAQLGRMFKRSFGAYAEGLVGVGHDRFFDWAVGVGVRFVY